MRYHDLVVGIDALSTVGFLQRLTNLFVRSHCRVSFVLSCSCITTRGRLHGHRGGAVDRDSHFRSGLLVGSVDHGAVSAPTTRARGLAPRVGRPRQPTKEASGVGASPTGGA